MAAMTMNIDDDIDLIDGDQAAPIRILESQRVSVHAIQISSCNKLQVASPFKCPAILVQFFGSQ